jgi:hypothetical protein
MCAAVCLSSACRPGHYDFYDQTDVVLTVPEPGRSFNGIATYGLWPEVMDLSNEAQDPIEIDHDRVDPALLDAVERNLDALGWTQVADPTTDDPDVVAVIGVVAQENWYLYSYYYWYDSWWWYYPGYYPPVYAVSYPSGSAIVALVKPDEAVIDDDGESNAPVVWVAGVWGQLSNNAPDNLRRVEEGIDQAFDQSPYLAGAP